MYADQNVKHLDFSADDSDVKTTQTYQPANVTDSENQNSDSDSDSGERLTQNSESDYESEF